MAHAEINGQSIDDEDSGGDGRPVVLAHGFLMDCAIVDFLAGLPA